MKNKSKSIKILSGAAILLLALVFSLMLWLVNNRKVFSQPYDQVAPRSPQNFSLKVGIKSAYFTWNENYESDIFAYLLYLREASNVESEPIFIGKTDNFLLDDLNPGKTYYASLAAQDTSKNIGPKTNEITFQVDSSYPLNFKVAGWIQASSDLEDAQREFIDNTEIFTDLSPFWYSLQADGAIEQRGNILTDEMMALAKNRQVNIIPTITNNFDQDSKASIIIKDSELRAQHIDNIISEVVINDYDGIDIDYENLDIEVKDDFTEFIETLAEKLHEKGKLLSVTVQAKKSDISFWDGAGAVNFKKVGEIVDQFRVMTYDYSRLNTDPGPISPIYWFEEVLNYAKSKVPAEKIMAGIPTYAYQWCTADNNDCESKGLTWDGVQNIISQYDPVQEWNEMAKNPWFMYIDNNNNTKVVYYENHQSIDEKLKMVKELGIGGISIWRLGSQDLQNFSVIRENLGKKIAPATGLKVVPMDQSISISWDQVENSEIKGYRLHVRTKEDLDIEGNTEALANLSAQELLDQIKSGEYDYASAQDGWKEENIDIFDENEYTLKNLQNGKTYYLSLTTLDWNNNLSGSGSEIDDDSATTFEFSAIPSDQYFPGTISDFKSTEAGSTTAEFNWTNTGDDYFNGAADQFDIRFSEDEITANNFSEAVRFENTPKPLKAYEKQSWQAGGLEPGKKYYVAMKVIDEAGNYSEMSNAITIETIDNIAPNIPNSIEASSLDAEIFVKWQANEEADLAGYKIFYKKESGYYEVVEIDPQESHYSITGLENGFNYYIAMSAYDYNGNESVRSEDIKVALTGAKNAALYQNTMDKYYEKLKASVVSFSKKLFNERAVPFIVVLSVLVVNFFIYQGIKREINRKAKTRSIVKPEALSTSRRSNRVVDLKNFKRIVK